jgi:hypothetical protein
MAAEQRRLKCQAWPDGEWRLARGNACVLERAFHLQKDSSKHLNYHCSAILYR